MEQSVPKRRHINFRRRGITQKKAYNIHYTAKVWNQEGRSSFNIIKQRAGFLKSTQIYTCNKRQDKWGLEHRERFWGPGASCPTDTGDKRPRREPACDAKGSWAETPVFIATCLNEHEEKFACTHLVIVCAAELRQQSPPSFFMTTFSASLTNLDCSYYVSRPILATPPLWSHRNTLIYTKTTPHTLSTCNISPDSITLSAPKAGDFVELILLHRNPLCNSTVQITKVLNFWAASLAI